MQPNRGLNLCNNLSSSFCMCRLLPAGMFSLAPSDCQSDVTPLCLWWMGNGLTVTIWSVFQMCLVYLVFHPIHLWTCAIIACSDVIIVSTFIIMIVIVSEVLSDDTSLLISRKCTYVPMY